MFQRILLAVFAFALGYSIKSSQAPSDEMLKASTHEVARLAHEQLDQIREKLRSLTQNLLEHHGPDFDKWHSDLGDELFRLAKDGTHVVGSFKYEIDGRPLQGKIFLHYQGFAQGPTPYSAFLCSHLSVVIRDAAGAGMYQGVDCLTDNVLVHEDRLLIPIFLDGHAPLNLGQSLLVGLHPLTRADRAYVLEEGSDEFRPLDVEWESLGRKQFHDLLWEEADAAGVRLARWGEISTEE